MLKLVDIKTMSSLNQSSIQNSISSTSNQSVKLYKDDEVRKITSDQLYEINTNQYSKEYFEPNELTVVTSLFDLSKHENRTGNRTINKYLDIGKHLLELPVNMIIATEADLADKIKSYRKDIGLIDKTFVYTVDLRNSPYYKYFSFIKQAFKEGRKPIGTSDTKDSPMYLILMWTRYWLLKQIVNINPFNSKGLMHIDYGIFYFHMNRLYETKTMIMSMMKQIPADKIKAIVLCETSIDEIKDRKKYFSQRRCKIACGYYSGSLNDINWLADQFDKELKTCLDHGYPALDEPIMSIIYCQNRSRFMPYYGDYQQCIFNNINMTDGLWIVNRNLEHCRAHTLHLPVINIVRYVLQAIEKKTIKINPTEYLKLMDELMIASWWIGKPEFLKYSKLAAEEIVRVWPELNDDNHSKLYHHYQNNIAFHGLKLLN